MGERRELNPRMVDSQSTALIHLATSAPLLYYFIFICLNISNKNKNFKDLNFYHYFFILFLRYDI